MTVRAGWLGALVALAAAAPAIASPIAFTRDRGATTEIWTVGEDGLGLARLVPDAARPAWSPDGTRLAFVRGGAVHVVAADGSRDVALAGGALSQRPAWSPDGARIAFARRTGDGSALWTVPAAGGAASPLTAPPAGAADHGPSWSPRGGRIAFTRTVTATRADSVAVVGATGGAVGVLADGRDPAWSPDGARIAFVSTRDRFGAVSDGVTTTYQAELYAMAADGSGQRRITHSLADEATPAWSPDGSRIVYSAPPVTAVGRRVPLAPRELFEVSAADGCGLRLTNLPGAATAPSWRVRSAGEAATAPSCGFEPVAVPDTDVSPLASVRHPVYWVGPTLDENFLSAVHADPVTPRDDDATLTYDDCLVAESPYCVGSPIQVISSSTCRWSPVRFARYLGPPRSWTVQRGAIVADYRYFSYVIAGPTTISFGKHGHTPALVVDLLRPLGAPPPAPGAALDPPALPARDLHSIRRALAADRAAHGVIRRAARRLGLSRSYTTALVELGAVLARVPVRTAACSA